MIEKIKSIINNKSFLTAGVTVLGATTIVFASLFTWKAVTNNGGQSQYTVTWDLGNGETIEEKYQMGEMPIYKGKTPSRPDDTEYVEDRMKYHYTFNGWQEDLVPVVKDTTYHVNYLKESLYFVIEIDVPESADSVTFYIDPLQDENEDRLFEIDWGDGNVEEGKHEHSHTYNTTGLKRIKIHSPCKSISFANENPEQYALTRALLWSVTLPYGWTTTGEYTEGAKLLFDTMELKIDTINLPTSITKIQPFVSRNDDGHVSLSNLVIPNGVNIIAGYAFNNLIIQESLIIPESVTTIETNAFLNSKMTNIVIPNTITSFQSKSLNSNNNYHCIYDFTSYDTPPTIVEDTFYIDYFETIAYDNGSRIKTRKDTIDAFLNAWSSILDSDKGTLLKYHIIFAD